jgi:internalin A
LLKDGLEATLARYPGLPVRRTIPCPGHNGAPCEHEFNEEQLVKLTERTPPRTTVQCPESGADVSIALLLYGWEEKRQEAPPVTEELRKLREEIERLQAQAHQRQAGDQVRHEQLHESIRQLREATQRELRLEELAKALAEQKSLLRALLAQVGEGGRLDELRQQMRSLAALMQREFANLYHREQSKIESHCPGAFVLRPLGSRRWLKGFLGQKVELVLLCQHPGGWHPTKGRYEFAQPAKWLLRLAPYIRQLCRVLKHTAPVVGPLLAEAWQDVSYGLEETIMGMEELAEQFPEGSPLTGEHGGVDCAEGAGLRALRHLLDELDPSAHWGGLRKVLTPEQHYLWLCEEHAAESRR